VIAQLLERIPRVDHQHLGESGVHLVGDHDAGHAELLGQVVDEPVDLGRGHRVETRRRLVVEENLGVERQGPGQARPLFHAARDLRRVLVGVLAEAHELQLDLDHHLDDVLVEHRVLLQGQGHVLRHRHRVEKRPGLKQDPDLLADLVEAVLVEGQQVAPQQGDAPRIGLQGPDHVPQQRGLARPRAAHHDHRLAGKDLEVHPVEDDLLAELLDEVRDLDQGIAVHRGCSGWKTGSYPTTSAADAG
jgi:hypothetical protein